MSEFAIIAAQRELAINAGLYVEPTSATVGAALTELMITRQIKPAETTVVILTGSGLKATQRIGELLEAEKGA